MVALTGAAIVTGGAAAPVLAVVAGTGTSAAGAAAVTAAGASAVAGTAAATGAVAGATVVGGAGVASAATAGILAGPIGWCILGASESQLSDTYTFDCWKQILHDDSSEPSNGRILKEIVMDPRIKQVTTMINNNDDNLPHLVLQNIWDEQFRIDYVFLPSDQLAAHAVKI